MSTGPASSASGPSVLYSVWCSKIRTGSGFSSAVHSMPRASSNVAGATMRMPIDQSEFFTTREAISLSRVGYIYVPHTCAAEPCRLHVAFHGCKQDLESVHDDLIRDAGYNQSAASNSIVVLYPQETGSAANPNRCWDFWGYSGSGYFGKDGPQMRAVKSMVDRLLGLGP